MNTLPFSTIVDKVIVSSDDSPTFLNFWPCVALSWKKFFGITPTLAFVSSRSDDDPLMTRLREHGDVIKVPVVPGIPIENQAKIARFLVASTMGKNVCMIDDIDTVHLQTHFLYSRLSQRDNGKILAIGHEVYENSSHSGKFPAGNMTAEGDIFKLLFNPKSLEYKDLVKSLTGIKSIDGLENVSNSASSFSDESLIRALIFENNLSHIVQKVRRDVNIREDWIDRSWWSINRKKLFSGNYICCNFFRPGRENYTHFLPIYEYLYGYVPSQDEVFVL